MLNEAIDLLLKTQAAKSPAIAYIVEVFIDTYSQAPAPAPAPMTSTLTMLNLAGNFSAPLTAAQQEAVYAALNSTLSAYPGVTANIQGVQVHLQRHQIA